MPFVKVGQVSDLAPDSVQEVLIDGQPYAICRVAGEIHALGGVCPHSGGPLGHVYQGYVVCPYHLWEFDCRTGVSVQDPSRGVEAFGVRVEDGEILLRIP
jgi:nitrite reductase (NADH) small subunit